MKKLCLCNKDLASNVALNMLLPNITKEHEVYLWLSTSIGKHKSLSKQLALLKYYEQDLFSRLIRDNAQTKSHAFTSFEGLQQHLNGQIKEVNQLSREY